ECVTLSNLATAILIAASPESEKLGSRHSRRDGPVVIRSPGAGTGVVVIALGAMVVVVVGLTFGDANVRGVAAPRAIVGESPDTASAESTGTISAEALTATIAMMTTRSCLTSVAYPRK